MTIYATELRTRMQERMDAFEAAQMPRRPLGVLAMEAVAFAAMGLVVVLFVAMLAQGFTLYDGLHVPGLWPL